MTAADPGPEPAKDDGYDGDDGAAPPPGNQGLGSWPWRRARITPDRVALSAGDSSVTYTELAERVARLAGWLHAAGVRPGGRVAYLGQNAPATLETFFACGLLGVAFVPLNTRLSAPELRFILGDCAPSALVHSQDTDALVANLLPDLPAAVLALHPDSTPAAATGYAEAVRAGRPVQLGAGLEDPALILYTSGTSGRPKGAVLSHGNLTWNTVNQLAHFDTAGTDVALAVAPLFHVAGFGQVTLPTLFKGGRVEVVGRFDPGGMLRMIAELQVSTFSAVPTMLQMMCEHESWAAAELGSLRYVVYGGSPAQERVARAWLARGVRLLQGYGMTEASPGVHMALPDGAPSRPVSVGVPHFFTDVAHLDGGIPVPLVPGDSHELLIRGPNVFAGYLNQPEATADAFVHGWYRTGDVVSVDGDGWASVVDRVKDLIISGGENVYPAEVEAVLVQLPQVAAAAVVAAADQRWGEVPVAFVQLRPGAEPDATALHDHLATNLARYKIPKRITFVEELPRNAAGKVLRARLRDRLRENG